MVFCANGLTAVPVEMARGARRARPQVIAVTSVAQSIAAGEPDPAVGGRLLDEADLVIDLCTPQADALVDWCPAWTRRSVPAPPSPTWPSSTRSRCASRSCSPSAGSHRRSSRGRRVVGAERSRALFDSAYREHARRVARAIVRAP